MCTQQTNPASHYILGEKKGSGNYGVVYKAREAVTGDTVAIKCSEADPDGQGMPTTTLREISLLRRLKHDNIIKYVLIDALTPTFLLVFVLNFGFALFSNLS